MHTISKPIEIGTDRAFHALKHTQGSLDISSSRPSFRWNPFRKIVHKSHVPPSVWIVGAVMCLINLSFVVVYSLSAVYLNVSLGISMVWVGLLEGTVEAISFLMKLCSGMVSDYLKRRKPIMVLGYFLTVISKALMGLSTSFGIVFAARMMERLGNGIQATPRDAMVGDMAPAAHRGKSFGLMRSLGTAGSFLGGLLGVMAMKMTNQDFQKVFLVATIPAFIAFMLLVVFVKEPRVQAATQASEHPVRTERRKIRWKDIQLLGKPYWALMLVVSIFMMARVSETLMVFHARDNFGWDTSYTPFIMSIYNITYCLSSFPGGWLSDRFGRFSVLGAGIVSLIVADLLLFSATTQTMLILGVLMWGVQMGVVHNTFISLITDYVPEDLRGTGFGIYYLIGAISSMLAGSGGGTITHYYGVTFAFGASFVIALISLISLLILLPQHKKRVVTSPISQ